MFTTHDNAGHCLSPKECLSRNNIPTRCNKYLLVVASFSAKLSTDLLGRLCTGMLTTIRDNISCSIKSIGNNMPSTVHSKNFIDIFNIFELVQSNILGNDIFGM